MDPARPSYAHVAWCYESIAAAGSRGRIAASKAWQLEHVAPGERMLYAGAGAGEDALLAAQRGVEVTALDLSPAMLARLARRLDAAQLRAELVLGDLFEYGRPGSFDVVAANYVLNVFPQRLVWHALARLASLLTPGGRLMIADFAPPRGSRAQQGLARAYYRPINVAAWALRLCCLHPIYDYTVHFEALGLRLAQRHEFALLRSGGPGYESLIARRAADFS